MRGLLIFSWVVVLVTLSGAIGYGTWLYVMAPARPVASTSITLALELQAVESMAMEPIMAETGATPPENSTEGSPEPEQPEPEQPAADEPADMAQEDQVGPQESLPLWQRWATPFDHTQPGPRITLVVFGLGLTTTSTETALEGLPAGVTLSFAPQSEQADLWISITRGRGKEAMMDLPLDGGLLPDDALALVASGPGLIGMVGVGGAPYLGRETEAGTFAQALNQAGYLLVDASVLDFSGVDLGPNMKTNLLLDTSSGDRGRIDAALYQIEVLAQAQGHALVVAQASPGVLAALVEWTGRLEDEGFVLAPVSALMSETTAHE